MRVPVSPVHPPRACLALVLSLCAVSCAPSPSKPSAQAGPVGAPAPRAATAPEIETSTPEAQGMSRAPLVELTKWVRDTPIPVFSILISRHGKLVYELYTSQVDRDDAHYLMSVTKSFVSALVGIAIDRHLLPGPDATLGDVLPRAVFPGDADAARFRGLTLRQVLGMQGVDAPDPPRDRSPEATARAHRLWDAPNRLTFVLGLPLLGEGFQYNDSTPTLATGAVQYATGMTALDFAQETLFGPMAFRNVEWMHQDAAGIDNGGYGLRLRPVDMQKFGLLYLHRGRWNGRQLVPEAWVARSFEPWNRSKPGLEKPDYGWFWWAFDFGPGWTAHVAAGWKGQRIAVFPDQDMVVTMTACIEDGTEPAVFEQIVKRVLEPAVAQGGDAGAPKDAGELDALLAEVHRGPARRSDFIEHRMVPSVTAKGTRRAFAVRP
jgi:CubicO group peptidase (beta-lactamase class C family)